MSVSTFFHPVGRRGNTAHHPRMNVDIRDYPAVCEAINAALNSKNIVEVKKEPKGIAVVEIKRQVKTIEKAE